MASGQVIPAQTIVVNPQVSGKITQISKNLQPGGRLKRGDFIAQIDKRDYELALAQSKANAESAASSLPSKRRSKASHKKIGPPKSSIVLVMEKRVRSRSEPQVQRAQMAYSGAQSAVKRAELSLGRTTLVAPFYCVVK